MVKLIAARRPPKRPTPLMPVVCCCQEGDYSRQQELDGYKELTAIPADKSIPVFKTHECCFTHCKTSLADVVKENSKVFTCRECNQFICHACKRDYLPEPLTHRGKRARRG